MRQHCLPVARCGERGAEVLEAHSRESGRVEVQLEKRSGMRREAIVGTAVGGPYSPAVIGEGRFVFVSGQGPVRDGAYVPGGIEEETRLTLDNLGGLLEQAGSGVEHVVRCGVWIVDLDDFGGMNRVYEAFFPEPRPARATVRADLILGKVEIDCIALVPG
jgi:2-iminobutanoate/2-iminopropanoate deaminase